ncbi:MAG: response regulator [Acidobacteriota bacterium]
MILAIMADLMFSVKIIDEAKKLGLKVQFVKDEATAFAQFKQRPELVIFDLNYAAANPLGLLRGMHGDPETSRIETVGFISHVQVDLRKEAQDAGCGEVIARSAFAQKLPGILARYAGDKTDARN